MDYKRRILAAREQDVTAGGRRFTVRRLGGLPLARIRSRNESQTDFVIDLVRESQSARRWMQTPNGCSRGGK